MRRPKIILASYGGISFFSDAELDALDEVGEVLDREPLGTWDDPRADALLAEAEVIVGHWGCPLVDAAVLDRAPELGLLAYAAGTVKETVTPEVLGRVRVTSGAPANAEPVAELTVAWIFMALKDVLWRRDLLRDPSLAPRRQLPARPPGAWNKTVGLIGASMVGRRVIELLAPFPRLDVALHDPFVSEAEAEALGVRLMDLDALFARSDVVSIHAPQLPSTHHMVGAAQLAALRTGATLINTARGSLLDHDALLAELDAGRLYAILDVTDPEPLPADHPLRTHPLVFLTPHLAGSEGTELGRMTEHVLDEVRRWTAGEPARNQVTAEALPRLA